MQLNRHTPLLTGLAVLLLLGATGCSDADTDTPAAGDGGSGGGGEAGSSSAGAAGQGGAGGSGTGGSGSGGNAGTGAAGSSSSGGSGGAAGSATIDEGETTDPASLAKAATYEAAFWERRDEFAEHLRIKIYDKRLTDADAQSKTYSSGLGHVAYFMREPLATLSFVLDAATDPAHRLRYAEMARDVIDVVVPAVANATGTENCTAKPTELYKCSPGNFRYLDAGHGAGGAGFIMNAIYEDPTLRPLFAAELQTWATSLAPILDRHIKITESTEPSGHPHMPAKIAPAHLALSKVLDRSDYADAFDRVVQVLVASAETNGVTGWVGSDVSHARVSVSVLNLAFREGWRGNVTQHVTEAHLRGVGDALEAARTNWSYNNGWLGDVLGHHGVMVRPSSLVASLALDAYDFTGTPGSYALGQPFETTGALAIGHATRLAADAN